MAAPELDFVNHLRRLGASAGEVDAHGPDLVLAFACSLGDEEALSVFDQVYIAAIPTYVARLTLSPDRLDELSQRIRVMLFTGSSPRILGYSGKGALGAWLRIIALRLAMDELDSKPRETEIDVRTLESLVAPCATPEREAMRTMWEPRIRQTIESALASLPARDKTLLRLHYLDGLNIGAIGTIYQVHRAAVARWLLAIREKLLGGIREQLGEKIPATTSGLRSAFNTVYRDLRISISRVLGTPDYDPQPRD